MWSDQKLRRKLCFINFSRLRIKLSEAKFNQNLNLNEFVNASKIKKLTGWCRAGKCPWREWGFKTRSAICVRLCTFVSVLCPPVSRVLFKSIPTILWPARSITFAAFFVPLLSVLFHNGLLTFHHKHSCHVRSECFHSLHFLWLAQEHSY